MIESYVYLEGDTQSVTSSIRHANMCVYTHTHIHVHTLELKVLVILCSVAMLSHRSYFQGTDSGGECGVPYERRFPMPRPSLDEAWWVSERQLYVLFLLCIAWGRGGREGQWKGSSYKRLLTFLFSTYPFSYDSSPTKKGKNPDIQILQF